MIPVCCDNILNKMFFAFLVLWSLIDIPPKSLQKFENMYILKTQTRGFGVFCAYKC
jgi:hypothetical protein